jgi:transposase
MGLRSDHQVGRSWGRRGETPVVPGTGLRFRCNMISALTNRGRLAFMVFKCRFTTAVFIAFLRRLLRHTPRPVILIVDAHPVHRAAVVKRWVVKNPRLRLVFLPGYSPDLKPDECLNHDVKTNAVGRRRPHTEGELMANVRGYLWNTQRQPAKVRRYFHHPSVSLRCLNSLGGRR